MFRFLIIKEKKMFKRKRSLVFFTIVVCIFLVLSFSLMGFASNDFNWRQCEGENIRVMLLKTGRQMLF